MVSDIPWGAWNVSPVDKRDICICHSGTGKTMETVKRSVEAKFCGADGGEGGQGWVSGAQSTFRAVKNTLYDTIMVDICHHVSQN